MKKYLFIATALAALASCSSDEFVGDNTSPTANNTPGAIQFVSNTPRITRADGSAAATTLGNKFKVYATKTTTEGTSNVFATTGYSTTTTDYNPYAYWVWWAESTAGTTASNTKDWEYVGATGTHGSATLTEAQTIKYWDYSASKYEFVAYSATVTSGSGESASPKISKYKTSGFTVNATAAELAGLYVADKVTLTAGDASDNKDTDFEPTKPATSINKIGGIVKFTFRAAGSKVRLGIYETINGYEVKNVKFRPNNKTTPEFTEGTGEALLSGSFNGTSSSASGEYNITYNATTGVAEFDNTATSANNYFDFGTFVTTAIGTSSTAPTWATGSYAYQSVLPNTDNVDNMILYVDYDLYNDKSGEIIHVKGAKAVVPSIYMTWNPNYAYTYLFKISDNTNGTTGTEGTSPEGLFPITFDAVTVATTDGSEVGIITTVSTPAITTYQENSVVDIENLQANPAISKHGITYAHANGPIYITVNEDGTLKALSADNTKLYTVDAGTTEADLILTDGSLYHKASSNLLEIPASGADPESIQGITFTAGEYAKFTPTANTTYAVEYTKIETSTVTTGDDVKGLYERSGESAPYTYTKTEDTTAQDGKTYYEVSTPQYKIIIVGADPSNP